MPVKGPFPQPKPSWRERRQSRRRLTASRSALAAAMPAPNSANRIDPLTGQPVMTARPSLAAAAAAVGARTELPRRGDAPTSTRMGGLRALLRTRRALWSALWRVSLLGMILSVCLTAGLPVLDHRAHLEWLLCAAVATALLGSGVVARWGLLTFAQRVAISAVGALFAVSFAAGLMSSPVVIDGVVYSETSTTAKEVRYAQRLRDNLLELGAMDKYLASSTAEAWSRTDAIKTAKARAQGIGESYRAVVDNDEVPAGPLGAPTSSTVTAAYAMAKALDLRLSLLAAQDDKLDKDLQAARAAFNTEWVSAGKGLGAAIGELDIPLSVPSGPTE